MIRDVRARLKNAWTVEGVRHGIGFEENLWMDY